MDSSAATSKAPAVVKMCRWVEVFRSGFYHWRSRPVPATAARSTVLAGRVRHFFEESEESEGTYGYRRIHADLADEGSWCSPEMARQFLRDEGGGSVPATAFQDNHGC